MTWITALIVQLLNLILGVVGILEHFVLVPEDVVMHIVLVWVLRGEHEGLHEPPEGPTTVRQLAGDLNHNGTAHSRLAVHLPYLSMAVLEGEGLNLLMNLLLEVKTMILSQFPHTFLAINDLKES